jgi:hypothetical protein
MRAVLRINLPPEKPRRSEKQAAKIRLTTAIG